MSELNFAPIAVADAHAKAMKRQFEVTPFGNRPLASSSRPVKTSVAENEPDRDYARGFSDGSAQSEREFAAKHKRMQALMAAASALQPEPSEELAALIVNAVIKLARTAIGNAVIDREWLIARSHEAAGIVSECDAAQTLWVHTDDVTLLEGAGLPFAIHADFDAAPGSIRIGCSTSWIEHGRPLCLEQLDAAIIAGSPVA
jgi:flagellar assembly protein FliH